jgi:hypothetical protein
MSALACSKSRVVRQQITVGFKTRRGNKPRQILLCNFISKIWNRHFCNNISKFDSCLPLAKPPH